MFVQLGVFFVGKFICYTDDTGVFQIKPYSWIILIVAIYRALKVDSIPPFLFTELKSCMAVYIHPLHVADCIINGIMWSMLSNTCLFMPLLVVSQYIIHHTLFYSNIGTYYYNIVHHVTV